MTHGRASVRQGGSRTCIIWQGLPVGQKVGFRAVQCCSVVVIWSGDRHLRTGRRLRPRSRIDCAHSETATPTLFGRAAYAEGAFVCPFFYHGLAVTTVTVESAHVPSRYPFPGRIPPGGPGSNASTHWRQGRLVWDSPPVSRGPPSQPPDPVSTDVFAWRAGAGPRSSCKPRSGRRGGVRLEKFSPIAPHRGWGFFVHRFYWFRGAGPLRVGKRWARRLVRKLSREDGPQSRSYSRTASGQRAFVMVDARAEARGRMRHRIDFIAPRWKSRVDYESP